MVGIYLEQVCHRWINWISFTTSGYHIIYNGVEAFWLKLVKFVIHKAVFNPVLRSRLMSDNETVTSKNINLGLSQKCLL